MISQIPIVVLGASGHAKVIIDLVEREGRLRVVGILDPAQTVGHDFFGYPVLGMDEDLPSLIPIHSIEGAVAALGDNFRRHAVVSKIQELCPGLRFFSAIHPSAQVARDVSVGDGSVLMAGVTVNPSCSIGRFCVLNTNSSLDHDSVMGDFASLGPNAATGGNIRVGAFSAVCLGASVLHGRRIGEHSIVGAGSTVLDDIGSFEVAYGLPAKTVRRRRAGDRYL